ncbi:HET-domain-containing protein [Xylaria grammica]|nr:HET-domain-containing protein [Xylaria grammica]
MYSRLSGPELSFRLLHLLPGNSSSGIQCQLSEAPLQTPPEFEALSYVWGDVTDTLPITVQGRPHNVTRNLCSALHSLRYPNRIRTLWVDALCINQTDISERNHQVGLMGRIYSTAKHVVAWLGEANSRDEDILRVIEASGLDPDLHWTEIFARGNPFSLYFFLRNPWWDRVWTAQEAVLAQDLTFQCGRRTISGKSMIGMLRSFNIHLSSCCIDLQKSWDSQNQWAATLPDILKIVHQQLELADVRDRSSIESFSQIASRFRHRQATDPRDKVYGLLGIVDDADNISINYSSSAETVYEESTRGIISKTRNLDLFCHTIQVSNESGLRGRGSSRLPSLPSWVPDWDADFDTLDNPSHGVIFRLRTLHLFNTCGSRLFGGSANSNEQGSLRVSGITFDVVERISPPTYRTQRDTTKVIQSWRVMAGVEEAPDRPYPSGGTILDAFWRTLCFDTSTKVTSSQPDMLYERATPDDRAIHDTFWFISFLSLYGRPTNDRLPGGFQDKLEGNRFSQRVARAILDRRFFVSKKGYMGLAPDTVKEGDMICVLAGGRLPFILRDANTTFKRLGDSSGAERAHTLIGDAYLHGIMDGEAVAEIDEGSFQTYKLI